MKEEEQQQQQVGCHAICKMDRDPARSSLSTRDRGPNGVSRNPAREEGCLQLGCGTGAECRGWYSLGTPPKPAGLGAWFERTAAKPLLLL